MGEIVGALRGVQEDTEDVGKKQQQYLPKHYIKIN